MFSYSTRLRVGLLRIGLLRIGLPALAIIAFTNQMVGSWQFIESRDLRGNQDSSLKQITESLDEGMAKKNEQLKEQEEALKAEQLKFQQHQERMTAILNQQQKALTQSLAKQQKLSTLQHKRTTDEATELSKQMEKLKQQEETLKQRSAELDHQKSKLRTQEEALNKSLVEQQKVKTHQQKMSAELDQQQSKLRTQEEALNKSLAEQQKVKIPPKDVVKTIVEDRETTGPRNPKNQRDAAGICEWGEDNLKDCYDLLWAPTRNASMWYFIGDSTMGRLFEPLRSTWKDNFLLLKSDGRSTLKNKYYYNFPEINKTDWTLPDFTQGEGPARPPATLYRTACSTCSNTLLQHKEEGNPFSVEFLASEYSRDVSFPTSTTTTSQETIALYMAKKGISRENTVCVSGGGFHDMIVPTMTANKYWQNVRYFHDVLNSHCGTMIRIGINACKFDRKGSVEHPQDNAHVKLFNQGVKGIMFERGGGNFFIDVYNKSWHTDHADFLHMDKEKFYTPIAGMFYRLMNSTRWTT